MQPSLYRTMDKGMKWVYEIPSKPGKYVVKTRSTILGTIRTMDAKLSFDKNKKPIWSFSNQLFYSYLN